MKIIKKVFSWLTIVSITIVVCAAFAFLFIGAWWLTWIIICFLIMCCVLKSEL